uniref:Uncharacterized protein n=1 Tax=Siphoviridae sp. ctwHj1 TaxID=2825727 RepID=A0A8S5U615_9CAUD|nr:MAG TPA: hypothetical protein [Siphoviridae sp. ctwHj1]
MPPSATLYPHQAAWRWPLVAKAWVEPPVDEASRGRERKRERQEHGRQADFLTVRRPTHERGSDRPSVAPNHAQTLAHGYHGPGGDWLRRDQ